MDNTTLKNKLKEVEGALKNTELMYQQLLGQRILLEDLIKECSNEKKE